MRVLGSQRPGINRQPCAIRALSPRRDALPDCCIRTSRGRSQCGLAVFRRVWGHKLRQAAKPQGGTVLPQNPSHDKFQLGPQNASNKRPYTREASGRYRPASLLPAGGRPAARARRRSRAGPPAQLLAEGGPVPTASAGFRFNPVCQIP